MQFWFSLKPCSPLELHCTYLQRPVRSLRPFTNRPLPSRHKPQSSSTLNSSGWLKKFCNWNYSHNYMKRWRQPWSSSPGKDVVVVWCALCVGGKDGSCLFFFYLLFSGVLLLNPLESFCTGKTSLSFCYEIRTSPQSHINSGSCNKITILTAKYITN